MTLTPVERIEGALWGMFMGDALAMPAHWYYDREALRRDYGLITEYLKPFPNHPTSIMGRSRYVPVNEKAEILHDQARFWGKPFAHYHVGLAAGENTLNLQLARELMRSCLEREEYDAADYLRRYVTFLRTPGTHRDTYVEECHRGYIRNHALGCDPFACATEDEHIGGLATVPVLAALWHTGGTEAPEQVARHVALTHAHDGVLEAAKHLTGLLQSLMMGTALRPALLESARRPPLKTESRLVWEDLSTSDDQELVGEVFSPACYIVDSYPATLALAWKYADQPEAALVANTMAGGDNCHRGAVLGALLGAAHGLDGFPHRWRDDLFARDEIAALVSDLKRLATA